MKRYLLILVVPVLSLLFVACSSKLDPKDCDKLRGDAFDLLNKAQHCNTDADCRQSDWPGCERPESSETFEKIKPMRDQFKKGKCEEPNIPCKSPPEVYCKQGLCVAREKGSTEGLQAPPPDQIQVK